jgi:hypothetical protein
MDTPILISPHWDLEFYVHIDTSNLAIGVMLMQNLTRKCNQLIDYASLLFNNVE